MNNRKQQIFMFSFLLVELILYILILTTGGSTLVWSSFISIVICFLYSLLEAKKSSAFIIGGLACTVIADLFLVVWTPVQRLWGMVFFLIAQTLYAIKLHSSSKNKKILITRVSLIVLAITVAFAVLKDKTDALAIISLCYYANLIVSIMEAFTLFNENKLFAIGLVLFLLCDTVIGLQVASGAYLPISESSIIHKIIFVDFNLAWFFYLPSQVLIALSKHK